MTRILVIQFDPDKTGGRIEDGMRAAGAELVRVMASDPIPDAAAFDGLLVLPSLFDPVDDRPEVHGARAAIIAARAEGIPVLGVCLGGQLVAQTAGAEIYRSQPELGIYPVRTTPAAQDDPLLAGIPAVYDSFHAHAFAFGPVPDATVLIESDACCQAMRIGDRAWLTRLLLRLTPHARVLAPPGYGEAHHRTVESALRLYDAAPAAVHDVD